MPRFYEIQTTLSLTFKQFTDWFVAFEPVDALSRISSLNWRMYGRQEDIGNRIALTSMARAVGIAHAGGNGKTATLSDGDIVLGIKRYYGISEAPYLPTDAFKKEKVEVASSYESFPFQDGSVEKAIYRYYLLYLHSCTRNMRSFDFSAILGMKFDGYFTIWLSLFAIAHSAFSAFSLPLKTGDRRMKRHFSRSKLNDEEILKFVNEHSTMIDELSTFERPINHNRVKMKYDPNPLLTKPIIGVDGETFVIPSPECFINILGNGIYYKAFANQNDGKILGDEFELYVANQFDELKAVSIHRIVRSDSDERGDWIVVFDEFSVIVEAKAQRLTANARGGGSDLVSQIDRFLGKAVSQINATNRAILDPDDREFHYVRKDKPILGLVLLMEPFYMANSVGLSLVSESPEVSIGVISAYELEEICALRSGGDAGRYLHNYIQSNGESPEIFSEWSRKSGMPVKENRLIRLAEAALPWSPYGRIRASFARLRIWWILKRKPWYEAG